jgi:hypothetical protein
MVCLSFGVRTHGVATVSADMVGCSSRRCKLSVQYNCCAGGHDKRDIGKGKAIPLQPWTGP